MWTSGLTPPSALWLPPVCAVRRMSSSCGLSHYGSISARPQMAPSFCCSISAEKALIGQLTEKRANLLQSVWAVSNSYNWMRSTTSSGNRLEPIGPPSAWLARMDRSRSASGSYTLTACRSLVVLAVSKTRSRTPSHERSWYKQKLTPSGSA